MCCVAGSDDVINYGNRSSKIRVRDLKGPSNIPPSLGRAKRELRSSMPYPPGAMTIHGYGKTGADGPGDFNRLIVTPADQASRVQGYGNDAIR